MGLDPRKVTRQLPQVDMKKTCLRDGNDRDEGISDPIQGGLDPRARVTVMMLG